MANSRAIIIIEVSKAKEWLQGQIFDPTNRPKEFAQKLINFLDGLKSGGKSASIEFGASDTGSDEDSAAATVFGTFSGVPAEGDTVTINGVELTFVDAIAHLAEQDLTYSAVESGPGGDDVSIEYELPAAELSPLSVEVTDDAILVSLETDAGDNALLVVQDLTYTAVDAGADGNDITIEYEAQVSGTHALDVNVAGTNIVVSLESEAAVAAVGTLDLTNDIVLTSVAAGASRNTNTFTTQVLAPAANPTDTVLADFTGTAAAIVCTITPNNGDNNGAVPVDLTTAELRELITTGAVVGKTVTITDASSFRILQTATGGGAAPLADGGEGDGVVATFADGVDFVPSVSTADDILAAIEAEPAADALVSVAVSGTGSDVQVAAAETPLAGGGDNIVSLSTADDILAAIEGDVDASALVTVVVSGTGSDVQTAFGPENLAGGEIPGNNEISISGSPDEAEMASRTADAINESTTVELSGVVSASADDDEVHVTCLIPGVIGNSLVVDEDADNFAWDDTSFAGGTGGLPNLSTANFSRA